MEAKKSNYVKRSSRIIKRGSSYDNILSAVENLEYTDSILQAITPLYSDTLKEVFIHMGVNIIIFLTSRSKRSRWRLKRGGVMISSKREQDKSPSWGVGQVWSKDNFNHEGGIIIEGENIGGRHGRHHNWVGKSVELWDPSSMSGEYWRYPWET